MAKSMLKTVAMATGVSTLLFVGFSSQTFAMSPFQASYQFGGVLKSMLTLNEAIIDVKEG